MKLRVCCINMFVPSVLLLPVRLSHIMNQSAEIKIKMLQIRGSQGMSHFGIHAHRPRYIFTSNKDECNRRLELGAAKAIWSHWLRRNKAISTNTDNRTYAQVVS